MFSGVGDEVAHRRRDLSAFLNFQFFFISFWLLLSSYLYANLSKNPKSISFVAFFFGVFSCEGGGIRSFTSSDPTKSSFETPSLNPATKVLQQPSVSSSQTSEQYFVDTLNGSKSGIARAPPTVPPHRFSLMARVSLGPSDALFPVGTSTTHDEAKPWQVDPICALLPTTISDLQDGGDPILLPSPAASLGFGWMGLISNRGPLTFTWPSDESCRNAQTPPTFQGLFAYPSSSFSSLRSVFCCPSSPQGILSQPMNKNGNTCPHILRPRYMFYNLAIRILHISYAYTEGRRHLHITLAMVVVWTCLYHLRNLVDRLARLVLDVSLFSERCDLATISSFNRSDLDHVNAFGSGLNSSSNLSDFKLHYPASTLLGDASQISRTLLRKLPQNAQHNSFTSPFKSSFLGCDLIGRRHQSNLTSVTWLWSCDYFWRFQQTLPSFRNMFPPTASFLEQLIKSSYASFARAIYDHMLVEDLSKLVFKYESVQASKDCPSIASFPKLSIYLENSWSLYLHSPCIVFISVCMNFPL